MKVKTLSGVNIQWPWSQMLLNGQKTIETRGYALPEKYKGVPLALIETPGKQGARAGIGKAKIIAVITFSGSYRYKSKSAWLDDFEKHCVRPDDPMYGYRRGQSKWAWVVERVKPVAEISDPPAPRGIVFVSGCLVQI